LRLPGNPTWHYAGKVNTKKDDGSNLIPSSFFIPSFEIKKLPAKQCGKLVVYQL
jgi:hypothetical protein